VHKEKNVSCPEKKQPFLPSFLPSPSPSDLNPAAMSRPLLVVLVVVSLLSCVEAARYTVVIGVDGMGGEFYFPNGETPVMDGLMANGSATLAMQDVIMTSSSQNWMSMIAGASPDQHGVFDNNWEVGDSTPTPTMFAVLREQRPNATIAVFHHWTGFGRLVEPGVPDVIEAPGDEDQTTKAAIDFLTNGRFPHPDLLFVHLDHVDAAGHSRLWGSNAYYEALNKADRLIGDMVDTLDLVGMLQDTAIFISSDHGGEFFSHDPDTEECRYIPFIASGAGINKGVSIQRELRVYDLAATVAESMGLQRPASWIARPVYEALATHVPEPAPSQKLGVLMVTEYKWIYDTTGR